MAKVSVIIPVYNVEQYLRECLESVVNQTLSDIEIICVNDGSKDSSLEILNEYAQRDERIKIINQRNQGAGIARNIGIENAKGEFVVFIDPDDLYPACDILELMYNKANENGVNICGGEFSYFINGTHDYKQAFGENLAGYLFEKDEIVDYRDYQFDYGYHRFIYNREFLIKNNIYFPNYKRFQDPPFFVKAMIKAGKFYSLHKITYRYRYGHNNINWTEEKVLDMLQGIIDNFIYAKQNNLQILSKYTYKHFKDHLGAIKENLTIKVIFKLILLAFINQNILMMFFQKIFSITNSPNKRHKFITILGIKIKILNSKKIYKELLNYDDANNILLTEKEHLNRFLTHDVSKKSVLYIEPNFDSHAEVIPYYIKYFSDLGYSVDLIMPTRLSRLQPFVRIKNIQFNVFYIQHFLQHLFFTKKIEQYKYIVFNSTTLYIKYKDILPPSIFEYIPELNNYRDKLYVIEHQNNED